MKRARDDGLADEPGKRQTVVPQQGLNLKVEDAKDYLAKVKHRFSDDETKYNGFLQIMKEFKESRIDTKGVTERVSRLFKGHKQLIQDFNKFLPPDLKIESQQAQPIDYDHAIDYVKRIKTVAPEIYDQFIKILQTYQTEQKNISEVYQLVATLMRDHPQLLEEFTHFLPDFAMEHEAHKRAARARSDRKKQRTVEPATEKAVKLKEERYRSLEKTERLVPKSKKPTLKALETPLQGRTSEPLAVEDLFSAFSKNEAGFFEHIRTQFRNSEAYDELLLSLNLFVLGILTKTDLFRLTEVLFSRHAELFEVFKRFIIQRESARRKDSWFCMPLSELNFTGCRRANTSYRELPLSYPLPVTEGRNELAHSVLNDVWVSLPQGSEDYSFKHMRKNQYEEALFKGEDERYEMDMVIETNASTLRCIKPILETIQAAPQSERSKIKYDKRWFNAIHLKSIARIYGEHGAEIIELLKKNPAGAVPVIEHRLRQKDVEWREAKAELNKTWKEICEKNYYKALDHRSFYFRQMDKKQINAKAFLQEVKQKYDTGAKAGHPNDPQYVFQLEDKSIHDDVCNLIAYTAEQSSAGATEKIRRFLQTFLRDYLGFESASPTGRRPPLRSFAYPMNTPAPASRREAPARSRQISIGSETDAMASPAPSSPATEVKESEDVLVSSQERPSDAEREGQAELAESQTESMLSSSQIPTPILLDIKSEAESVRCKPIVALAEAPTEADNTSTLKASSQLLFGNNSFYIFFRYYQIIYERLAKAKEMVASEKRKRGPSRKAEPHPIDVSSNGAQSDASSSQSVDKSTAGGNGTGPQLNIKVEGKPPASKEAKPDERDYQSFLTILYSVLDGSMDSNRYEDEVRSLLGNNSYLLFTFDKVLSQTVKILQTIVSDETCNKLMALYIYERSRTTGFVESIYQSNCTALIIDGHCYRFLWDRESQEFSIQYIESPFAKLEVKMVEAGWSQYVHGFIRNAPGISADGEAVPPSQNRVFLTRNKRKYRGDEEHIMDGTSNQSGLEYKVSIGSYKLCYVDNSEDYFHRPKKQRLDTFKVDALRARSFQAWHNHWLKQN
eukprot:GILJ01004468.1.p1 GENE.GILJ01004468.1~~GILJ01004468.1.p1  ORF type:complete len:1073 (+),score=176.80 GILJ01004468.1:164-3382(+)